MSQTMLMKKFVENTDDKLHCTQASLMMSWKALTGKDLSMREAETATGFRAGVETWPYGMIAWLGEQGAEVIHIDAMDPVALAQDPRQELARGGFDKSTIAYFYKISDFPSESRAIKRALRTGNVRFQVEIPDVGDIPNYLDAGWLIIASVNATVLGGGDSQVFDGHVVVIHGYKDGHVTVQDPGPPPRQNYVIPLAQLKRALQSPTESAGTLTVVRMKHERPC